MVRAKIEAGEACTSFFKHLLETPSHFSELIESEFCQRNARLVGDYDQRPLQACETRDAFLRFGREGHFGWIDVVGNIAQHSSIFVQKDSGFQGHDVSFMGSTITSGMTVCGGCVSTNFMARATLCGSCNVSTSISGKRSRRNGVRIPPAMTAETLMPIPRSSACKAWVRPI